jgi:hypothetical protein
MPEISDYPPAYPAYRQAGAGSDFKKIAEIFQRAIHTFNRYLIREFYVFLEFLRAIH